MSRLKNPEPLAAEIVAQFEAMRAPGLQLISVEDDGAGSERLPNSVYGFTYSPAEENFPFFRKREWRSYEAHKSTEGEISVVGYLNGDEKSLFDGADDATIHLFPEPIAEATHIVSIPMKRVIRRVEYSQRGGKGLELTIRGQ